MRNNVTRIRNDQLHEIYEKLKDKLAWLSGRGISKISTASMNAITDLATPKLDETDFARAQRISHTVDFLILAESQKSTSIKRKRTLERIEDLIASCYEPVKAYLTKEMKIKPEEILAVYFESQFVARPQAPVPFLIVPGFFEGNVQEEWMAVAHETGHHIYRQVPDLREEIEVVIAEVLQNWLNPSQPQPDLPQP